MSLILLPNTAWEFAAQIKPTDSADVDSTDTLGVENVVGGHRHHAWTQSGTSIRRLAVVDMSGRLACSHVVLADAKNFDQHQVRIHSFSSYPSSSVTEFNSADPFIGPYVGKKGRDYVVTLSSRITGKEAIVLNLLPGTAGAYTRIVNKFYVADAFTFNWPNVTGFSVSRFPDRVLLADQQSYLVDERWTFSCDKLTAAEAFAFASIHNLTKQPLFVYDPLGTLISYKLLHGIITSYSLVQNQDDFYSLNFNIAALRYK